MTFRDVPDTPKQETDEEMWERRAQLAQTEPPEEPLPAA